MIVIYDHGMHDDTSGHDVPKSSRSSHDSKLGYQNPKFSLHIFHGRRLCIAKLSLILTIGFDHRLHKCLPPWVDAIGKIIAIVVLLNICFKPTCGPSRNAIMFISGDCWTTLMSLHDPGIPNNHAKSMSRDLPRLQRW
jgi:hypothetical protein